MTLRPLSISTYHDANQKVKLVEQEEKECRYATDRPRESVRDIHPQRFQRNTERTLKASTIVKGKGVTSSSSVVCQTYDIFHSERPCYHKIGRCLKCGATDHWIRHCHRWLRGGMSVTSRDPHIVSQWGEARHRVVLDHSYSSHACHFIHHNIRELEEYFRQREASWHNNKEH